MLLPFFLILSLHTAFTLDLHQLSVPTGFTITKYIEENTTYKPRSLAVGYYNNATIVYVGSASTNIYALIDYESDSINDKTYLIWSTDSGQARNLALDNIHNTLYIAVWHKTYKCINIHSKVLSLTDTDDTLSDTDCKLWFQGVPYTHHGDHYMVYDYIKHQLCMAFGAEGNNVDRNYPETNILCFNDMDFPDYQNVKLQAKGVRHSVGLEFHPTTNDLWFTDNNRDKMGDNYPDGKLNHVSYIGEDFGYPYCHSGGFGDPYLRDIGVSCHVVDDQFGSKVNNNCSNFTVAAQPLGPHVAALGMKFYYNRWNKQNGYMFPDKYYHAIFIAEHGSWDRSTKIGARVMVIYLGCDEYEHDYSRVIGHELFLDGMIVGTSYIGRPVDIEMLYDGSILITDDYSMNIYRVIYHSTFIHDTLRAEYLCNTNMSMETLLNHNYTDYCIVASPSPTTTDNTDNASWLDISIWIMILFVININ